MMGFGRIDGPNDPNEDVIIVHLGKKLPEAQYNRVVDSIVAFLNNRWPNIEQVGIDN